MTQRQILAVLEALAVGDALGQPVEFMTRREIADEFGLVSELIPPARSRNHPELPLGSVTDDTEQNLYMIREYLADGVTVEATVRGLLRWLRETNAEEKRYVGPSSLRALNALAAGASPAETGLSGTTCGGIMRSPSAALCSVAPDEEGLARDVQTCCLPTHNTSPAMEAAVGYAFALRAALAGETPSNILYAAMDGAAQGLSLAPYRMCTASGAARLRLLADWLEREQPDADRLLDFLFDTIGTGLPSEEVFPSVMGIFLYTKTDVWLAVRLGASVGGDTDTIACLAGALCAAHAGGHNLPADLLAAVTAQNGLDLPKAAASVAALHKKGR